MKTKHSDTKKKQSNISQLTSECCQTVRQICIAHDKSRTRRWAEERRLKREPLVVAKTVARVSASETLQTSQKTVLHNIKQRKQQLLEEVSHI